MILTIWVGVKGWLIQSASPLVLALYRDGAMHYIVLSGELFVGQGETKPADLLRLVLAWANVILYLVAPVRR